MEKDEKSIGYKQPIPKEIKKKMEGVSMQHFCGITYEQLSYLTIPYYDFNGNVQNGHMVVNSQIADEVLKIFQELFIIKYPIEKMQLIDDFTGENKLIRDELDYAALEANNTSSFNDRPIVTNAGIGEKVSLHAKGLAIDINPQINPYIDSDGFCPHENAQKYITGRDKQIGWTEIEKKACIREDTEIYKIFTKYGWTWLGNKYNTGDTQHFQKEL